MLVFVLGVSKVMKRFCISFLVFTFLFNTKISLANSKKIYPYKKISFKGYISNFASFYKNSNTIVFLDPQDTLVFYSITTGKTYKKKLNINGYKLGYAQISPNCRYIVFDEVDKVGTPEDSKKHLCIIYDLEKDTYEKIVQDINVVMWDSSFSNDSNYFLLRVADDVYVYNIKTEKVQSVFKKIFDYYSEPSYISCCSKNNKNFITMGKDGVVLRNLKTGKEIKGPKCLRVIQKFSNNGKYVAINKVFDINTLKEVFSFEKDSKYGYFDNFTFSQDSNNIVCGFEKETENLFVYSIKDKVKIAILTNNKKNLNKKTKYNWDDDEFDTTDRTNIQYSPDDKYILAKGKNYITIWKIK